MRKKSLYYFVECLTYFPPKCCFDLQLNVVIFYLTFNSRYQLIVVIRKTCMLYSLCPTLVAKHFCLPLYQDINEINTFQSSPVYVDLAFV